MRTFSKNLKIVSDLCATNGRGALQCVRVTEDKYVASDSYKLIEVERNEPDSKDFPLVKGELETEIPRLISGKKYKELCLMASDLKKLSFPKLKKKQYLPPVLNNKALVKTGKDGFVSFVGTDLNVQQENTFRAYQGEYPNYRGILVEASRENKSHICIDTDYLIETLTAFKKPGVDEVLLSVSGKQNAPTPLLIRGMNEFMGTVGVVMSRKAMNATVKQYLLTKEKKIIINTFTPKNSK